jgi:WD40 repeat protein
MPGEPAVTLELASADTRVCWAPGRNQLVTVTAKGLVIVDGERGWAVRELGEHAYVHELAWSPDARALALASGLPGIRAISALDGSPLWSHVEERESVRDIRWSPDGRRVAGLGYDVFVLDAATGRLCCRSWATIDEIEWSPDSRWLLMRGTWRGEGEFRVCDPNDGQVVLTGAVHRDHWLGWSDAGEALFSDGAARLGAVAPGFDDRRARSSTFSRDGTHAAAEGDRHVLWVQRPTGVLRVEGHPRTITGLAWSSRGDLATTCRDREVRLVRADSEVLVSRWQTGSEVYVAGGLAWSDDGAWLAVWTRERLHVLAGA